MRVKRGKMNGIKTPSQVVHLHNNMAMHGEGISASRKTNFYFPFEGKIPCEHELPNGLSARATAQRKSPRETMCLQLCQDFQECRDFANF